MFKKFILVIVILIIAVLFFVPKGSFNENASSLFVCNCLGIEAEDKCFGITIDCSTIEKPKILEKKDIGSDIALVLDKSQSMQGSRLLEAKQAAYDLIDSMNSDDAMEIIEFDENAKVLQSFTNDKETLKQTINTVRASDETFYSPALQKTMYSFAADERRKKLIFISDGEPSSGEYLPDIYDIAYELTSKGICMYTIGYGDDITEGSKAEDILEGLADISSEMAGCGNYYKSTEDALSDIFSDIYKDLLDEDLEIELLLPRNQLYNSTRIPFNLFTNTGASCIYYLNNAPGELILSKNFTLNAKTGLNNLRVVCKKNTGEETEEASHTFFVKATISELFDKKPLIKQKVDKLTEKQVELVIEEIIGLQKLDIVRKMSPKDQGTLVYVLVENTKPVPIRNVQISQIMPRELGISLEEISSSFIYDLKEIDPLEIEFHFPVIAPDEVISFNYYVDERLNSADLGIIKTEVRFDDLLNQDLQNVIAVQNKTRDLFVVKSSTKSSEGGTKGIISLRPTGPANDVKIYLKVPKCLGTVQVCAKPKHFDWVETPKQLHSISSLNRSLGVMKNTNMIIMTIIIAILAIFLVDGSASDFTYFLFSIIEPIIKSTIKGNMYTTMFLESF